MLARRRGFALVATALLLLLQHGVEALALFGRQDGPEFLERLLELLPAARLHGLHELLHPLLAFLEDFVNRLALFGGEVEFPLDAAQELDAHDTGREGLGGAERAEEALGVTIPAALGVMHQ